VSRTLFVNHMVEILHFESYHHIHTFEEKKQIIFISNSSSLSYICG
jgi:hypothetical protein